MSYERTVRLNKWLADTGLVSRRDADTWIEAGRVTINGAPCDLGSLVEANDEVRLDGELVRARPEQQKRVYIALHKPIGVVSTADPQEEDNIVDFVGHQERIFPIGRLDKDSDGLILLTNDGDIVNKILRSEHNHEKEYVVTVDRPVNADFLRRMARGVPIGTQLTKPCTTYKLGRSTFGIVLTQGLNRQIRRMCDSFEYRVLKLTRIRIMNVSLGHLKLGRWRNLTPVELQAIQDAVNAPKSAAPAAAKPVRRAARVAPKPRSKVTSPKALARATPGHAKVPVVVNKLPTIAPTLIAGARLVSAPAPIGKKSSRNVASSKSRPKTKAGIAESVPPARYPVRAGAVRKAKPTIRTPKPTAGPSARASRSPKR